MIFIMRPLSLSGHTVTIMRSRQTIRARVGRIASTVVQRDVVDINTRAIADTKAMDRIVLDVYVMD